ncbi:MAG TPA: hypothetical protein PK280_01705 [Planctomycetota bacterium]|nr:hypothetical protein [Planctomycetota bacterium]
MNTKSTVLLVWFLALSAPAAGGETVRLPATADVWLSDANAQERDTSSGRHSRLKLKSIQEMAIIRFDATAAAGREVLGARLFLKRAGPDQLRYIRVSTVNADWAEGSADKPYSPGDGATYTFADFGAKRSWAWPGSCLADVIMSSGDSLATWAERKELADGWISVAVTPEIVYALVAGDSDGLAVMDGGTIALANNFVWSREQKGSGPYLEVDLGGKLEAAPGRPVVKIEPAPERAHLDSGALKVIIEEPPAGTVCSWRLRLNDKPVERWRVAHPAGKGPTVFFLEDLKPGEPCKLEVVAVAPGGRASEAASAAATASAALAAPPDLGEMKKPDAAAGAAPPEKAGALRFWALPPLVKIGPEKAEALCGDLGGSADPSRANAVWDGRKVRLCGARGEIVSFQVCIERLGAAPLGVGVWVKDLAGPGGQTIAQQNIDLYRNWYAKNRAGVWQPAYATQIGHGQGFRVPDPARFGEGPEALKRQTNQTLTVDLWIPKTAKPGKFAGTLGIEPDGGDALTVPVELEVFDFELPDRLSFWPELNAYRTPPGDHLAWYRLAQAHRSVLNCWRWAPEVKGAGKDIKVVWERYDREAGPLLSGEAFRGARRDGVPIECLYLPFEDSWPTELTKETYRYPGRWPGRGDSRDLIVEQCLKAPYIGDALSRDYKDAFLAVQRQFVEHFREKGWTRTEMQCFFGGKNTHRIEYGSNMWWTTDEPAQWEDWLALQFFDRLWTSGRTALGADARRWAARADISRPQWQGRVLAGATDTVYFGAGCFGMRRTIRRLNEDTGIKVMAYGSTNPDNVSNTRTVAWLLDCWLNGADGALPWQTLGSEASLDTNDAGAGGGNALLVPGKKIGHEVLADLRLKAMRDGEQLIEYLVILGAKRNLNREQIRAMLAKSLEIRSAARPGANPDDADALEQATIQAWQLEELRWKLAGMIVESPARQ